MVNCLGMNYSKSIISSIKKETFDHTVLLRYCAILSEIEMNLLGMNSPKNIICSGFIENQKKMSYCTILCHTVHFRYCAVLWEEIDGELFGDELFQKHYFIN